MQPNKVTVVEVMQKADSNSSDGTAADSEQKVEDISVSQHSSKPHVVGSQSHDTLDNLFDKKFGSLDGCPLLSHEEYLEHKKFSLSSGLFAFQVQKYGWSVQP